MLLRAPLPPNRSQGSDGDETSQVSSFGQLSPSLIPNRVHGIRRYPFRHGCNVSTSLSLNLPLLSSAGLGCCSQLNQTLLTLSDCSSSQQVLTHWPCSDSDAPANTTLTRSPSPFAHLSRVRTCSCWISAIHQLLGAFINVARLNVCTFFHFLLCRYMHELPATGNQRVEK